MIAGNGVTGSIACTPVPGIAKSITAAVSVSPFAARQGRGGVAKVRCLPCFVTSKAGKAACGPPASPAGPAAKELGRIDPGGGVVYCVVAPVEIGSASRDLISNQLACGDNFRGFLQNSRFKMTQAARPTGPGDNSPNGLSAGSFKISLRCAGSAIPWRACLSNSMRVNDTPGNERRLAHLRGPLRGLRIRRPGRRSSPR